MLEKKMQDLFLSCLDLKEEDRTAITSSNGVAAGLSTLEKHQQLRHVLKSYGLLSKQRQAEQLFADSVVKPYLAQV